MFYSRSLKHVLRGPIVVRKLFIYGSQQNRFQNQYILKA